MKKIMIGLVMVFVMASASMALQLGVGVSDVVKSGAVSNGTGVSLVVKGLLPETLTVGGIYTSGNSNAVTASCVSPCGLGINAIYNGVANQYTANVILEKEALIGNGLSVVLDIDLATFDSVPQTFGYLGGGSVGIREAL
ncbi:MAG: hypothetical protein NTV24_03485 [Candidatus Woesebacteria bacterium]|nr:hypothetical protein [Candidatus Woesebacteria bacterium]